MSIVEFLSQPLWQRLGLTLVHFLWQGLAVAVLVSAFVKVFRLKHGNARYAAYLLAFIAMIVCPVVTFTAIDIPISPNTELVIGAESAEVVDSSSYTALSAGDILAEAETSSPAMPTLADSIPLGQRISDLLNVSMPWVLVIWMVGVIVLSVRLLMGFVGVYRWRHHLEPLPERLAQRIASLSDGLGMRNFSCVFISPAVLQAIAVGYLRPMVLLPAAMVTQMQPEMLEAVIAHELAHIRRFDLWVNLAQRVTETLLFYHPAVWWLSNCLRSERELCCDELAVKATGERVTYASTLESAGRARFMAKPPILATGLGQNNKATLGRVRHILGLTPTQGNCPFWVAGVIAVLVLAAIAILTTLALTNQSGEELSLNVETADGLPVGWKLDYDDGSKSVGSEGKGRHWRSGMAENLAELRIIPTPANEYDQSWKEERINFEILSLSGKHVGDFHFLPNTVSDSIILVPDKYVLSYIRGAVDLESNCTIPLDSTKFEVDLSGAGMYQLKFTPKLKDSGTVISDKYPPTTCKGKVIDVNGNQLGRIKVAAYEMFFNMAGGLDMRLIGEAVTKADGAFVFKTRPSVKKSNSMGGIVVAQKEGLSVGWADWPLYGEQKVTIMLGKPAKLAGFVVDENGERIANAEVRSVLFKKKTSEKEKTRWLPGLKHLRWLAVRTDRKGRFEFNNIPDDARSDLIVSAEGFGTIYTHKPENLSTGYEGAEFIAGQTDIRVELTAEGRIEGKVIDSKNGQGVAGVKLAVVPTFSPFFFERFLCISREDGTFSIGGLRSGEYVIRGDFPKLYRSVKSGKKTDVQVEVEKPAGQVVVEGIRANRDKFKCGYLAWSSKQITARFADSGRPATELAGEYELWWDGKKMATKYVRDQVYKDPEGNFRVEKQQGGNSYDGGVLSRKPDFRSENWLGPEVTRWRGLGSQDWLIRQDSKQEGISKDWSVVETNGVKLIRAITRNMNETDSDYRAYSIRDYNPSKGYGLVNEEWYNPDGSPRMKHTVKLQGVIPGGWFPVEVDVKFFAITDGRVYSHQNYALDIERCSFNDKSALPDRVFKWAVDKQLKYQEKLQKYLAMELEGLSDVKETAKADKVKRGAREAIEKFVASAMAGDLEKAGKYAHPDRLPANQIADITEIAKGQNLWIMAVVADNFSAIAVSSVIRGDHDRIGPLVFFLDRVSQDGRDNWWVHDIDMETPDGAEGELKQFLEKHPKAKKVPYENKPDVQVVGGQTLQERALREINLPDVDESKKMLDLASGKIVEIPSEKGAYEDIDSAINKFGKGDLIYDGRVGRSAWIDPNDGQQGRLVGGLFLARNATIDMPANLKKGPFEGLAIPEHLPIEFAVATKQGRKFKIKILSADNESCQLQYWPLEKSDVQVEGGEPLKGVVDGTVFGPDGKPIENATVQIREKRKPGQRSIAAPDVYTDANGYYEYDEIDWPYYLGVIWYEDLPNGSGRRHQYKRMNKVFEKNQSIDFRFKEFPKGTSAIIGKVTDQNGDVVNEFTVDLRLKVDWEDWSTEYLNQFGYRVDFLSPEGRFEFNNLTAGTYRVRVTPAGRAYDDSKAHEIMLIEDISLDVAIQLLKKNAFYGRILFDDGTPGTMGPGSKTIVTPMPATEPSNMLWVVSPRIKAVVNDEGYFTVYLSDESFKKVKSGDIELKIEIQPSDKNVYLQAGKFPFELLSSRRVNVGVLRIKRPPTGQGKYVKGNIEFEKNIPLALNIGSSDNLSLVSTKSIRFEEFKKVVYADLTVAEYSWPRFQWYMKIEILDANGKVLDKSERYTKNRATNEQESLPQVRSFRFGHSDINIDHVRRFRVLLEYVPELEISTNPGHNRADVQVEIPKVQKSSPLTAEDKTQVGETK